MLYNGLEAYGGEVNLEFDKNLISNEYAVKLCLDYEFIINPEEDDSEPGVILERSFLRLAHGFVDFELPPFICKMGKSNCNKKRTMENLNLFYQYIRPSSLAGGNLTKEEAEKEALAVRISQKFALLEEEKHVELDRNTMKEEEYEMKRIKGEALKEKDDPGAFIFLIMLEGKVNENALADTRSYINHMPYQIYKKLGREEMKKIDKGIIMINHTQAEAMGKLYNVLYILFLTFDGACHQAFRAARFDVLRTAESDSDDAEEYIIKRNRLQEHTMEKPDRHDPNAQDNTKQWKRCYFHKFTTSSYYGKDVAEMLSIAFNINEPINAELCHEFYSTYEFDKVCARDEVQSKKIIRFRLGGRAYNLTLLEFAQILGLYQVTELEEEGFNVYFEGEDVVRSLSALIYCTDLDTTTLRDLIDSDGKIILKDPQPGVPRVGIPRPPRASMQDLYDRMGRIEIRHEAMEHMEYRQSYH
nr:hypothetical protein [Tanacetum cinerariifolium]